MRDVSSAKPGYTDTETRQGSEGFAVTTVSARNAQRSSTSDPEACKKGHTARLIRRILGKQG